MGLETVEFVLQVEEDFCISVPDDCFSACTTVGQFAQFVCRRARSKDVKVRVFDDLCGDIVATCGLPKTRLMQRKLRPSAKWDPSLCSRVWRKKAPKVHGATPLTLGDVARFHAAKIPTSDEAITQHVHELVAAFFGWKVRDVSPAVEFKTLAMGEDVTLRWPSFKRKAEK
jgi:hypothetical protein